MTVIAITEQPNKDPKLKLTKDDWNPLITGAKRFAHLHASLKAFDWRLFRMIKKNFDKLSK